MANRYQHVPLPSSRCIRLIHLEPATDINTPLRCQLIVVSLADCSAQYAEYTALSYSWDAQTPSRKIDCGGCVVLITPNCEAALQHLRCVEEVQTLWIDSVCINQATEERNQQVIDQATEERNQQVKMMGEIYKNASRVVVWVGESDSKVETAIQQLMDISALPVDPQPGNRRWIQRQLRERVQRLVSGVMRKEDDPIGPLFERSWFHRMWTIQEVTLSLVDRVFLCCGKLTVPWYRIILAVDYLIAGKYKWGDCAETMKLLKQLSTYLMALRYKGARESLDDNLGDIHNDPLAFAILINAREKSSTNPKDKIFALHGVFAELKIPFPDPDYGNPVEEIYRDSVIACINYDKNLYVLYHVSSDDRRDGLASWVPDWSNAGWKNSDPRYCHLRGRFAAGGLASSSWRFSADQNQLIITGRIVDSIIYRAHPLTDKHDISPYIGNETLYDQLHDAAVRDDFFRIIDSTCSVLRTWIEVSQWSDYPTGDSTKEALKQTLVNENPKLLANSVEGFDSWYQLMTTGEFEVTEMPFRKSPLVWSLLARCEDFLPTWIARISQVQHALTTLQLASAMKFHSLVVKCSLKKCFFLTENGYFGTAPDPIPVSVEAGDRIAVVGGLEMPLLLRPVEGGYRLLTHIYVRGIMHGEVCLQTEQAPEEIVLV